jgi:hypothetical protein
MEGGPTGQNHSERATIELLLEKDIDGGEPLFLAIGWGGGILSKLCPCPTYYFTNYHFYRFSFFSYLFPTYITRYILVEERV